MAKTWNAKAYSAASATSPLASTTIPRRDPTEHDVQIEILFCGSATPIFIRFATSGARSCRPSTRAFPVMRSSAASPRSVSRHQVQARRPRGGRLHGRLRPHLPRVPGRPGTVLPESDLTYNFPDKHLGGVTYGGYSDSIVVDERFVLRVPANLDLAGAAPLLCAGITTYSPMRHWGVTKGKKVGVVGLGGLGHMGVKFAHALGAHVVVFTTSPSKKEDALRLGADEVVISRNADEMEKHAGSFDFILDAVSADHDINAYHQSAAPRRQPHARRRAGEAAAVAAFASSWDAAVSPVRRSAAFTETQEMLDFCGEHNITADVEVIPIQKVNEAYERLLKSDVKYRFSIDMASLKSERTESSLRRHVGITGSPLFQRSVSRSQVRRAQSPAGRFSEPRFSPQRPQGATRAAKRLLDQY